MTCRWAWLRPSRSVLARTSPGSRWYRTRVAVSASRPAASSAVRVPASPAALRSPRWCITRMFCTPYWRASLKLACANSATPGEASRCQASSWTTMRRTPSARVQPEMPATHEADRGHPERRAQAVVLAFDVGDQRHVAEQRLPIQVELDQAALAVANVPQHQHVGAAEPAGLIQPERIEASHAIQRVTPDDHPAGVQRGVSHERVDGLGVPGRAAVGSAVGPSLVPHQRLLCSSTPRASGRVQVNAWACWPSSCRSSQLAMPATWSTDWHAWSRVSRSGAVTVTVTA